MNSEKLFNSSINETCNIIESLSWDNKAFYCSFLSQTYFFVAHSTRLLARMMSLTPLENRKLFDRCIKHLSEEKNHEVLAETDLKQLEDSIHRHKELPETKAFYQTQYYRIETSQGVSLLGYILFLEAIACGMSDSFYKNLEEIYGQKSCKFLKLHAEEDPSHVTSAIEEINRLNQSQQSIVWENFNDTRCMYTNLLNKIEAFVNNNKNDMNLLSA